MSSSAPAGGGTPLADMSLSRRFLSLPQELAGASLPPQVSGKRCGSVALCVPHILESAVSSRPLPRVALVRVRWWGEQAPGSLFRPSLLSGDAAAAEEDAPQRAIAVKYPVTVQPEQLVEYFHDMRHLTLDVIDRDSRKKVGESRLSLELERDNAEMTAEEKLVALRRENALCEIKPSDEAGEQDEVLGYLAVSFDVQWTDETKVKGRGQVQAEIEMESQEDVDELSSASSTSLPSNREWTAVVDTEKEARRPVVMVGPRQGERKEEGVNMERKTREESVQSRMPSEDSQRIQRLLLKGNALRQSMERAVKDKENDNREELDVVDIGGQGGGYLNVPDELAGEQKADEHDPYTEFTNTTGTLDEAFALKSGPIAKMQNKMTAQLNGGVDSSFLDQFNALTLTFQSLELERDFVALQLHHLRDSSSVSSRFSPIEIRVSHDHVATPLYRNANKTDFPEVSAFSVTTSLRRRHWQLECSSSMALTPPSFLPEGDTSTASKCDGTKPLRFLVRCENQSDARRSKKREAKNLFPRPSKCILLEGVLPGTALFDTERGNRDRPTSVPLFIVGDPDGVDSKKVAYGDHRGARMNRLPRTKKPQPVGYLKVKYEFCDLTPSNSLSESGGVSDGAEDFDFSSVSSSPSERLSQKDQVGLSNARELLVGKQELAPKFGGSGLFQLGVMIDCVSNVNVFESPSDRSPLARGDRAQSTASRGGSRGNDAVASREAASVSLHYSVPSVFTRRSAPSIKFERTAKRKLRCSDFSASLSADFMGSIHVFQSLFADDASDYFLNGYLIIEAWLHTADAESTLLGLSKVPLSEFAGFVRSKEVDLLGFSKKTLPAASVDGKFAIENPFTGRAMGYLQVRVCVGTAEQLLAWASTIRAIVRLQGVARGALCRKRLGAFRGSRCLQTKQESREPAADSWSVVQSTADSRCSDSVSTAPTLDTARVNFVDRCNQDERMEQRLENLSENSDVVESDLGDRERRVALRKVCFNIRESWRSAILHEGHMGSTHHQRGMKSSPPLGCELQGHLVLTGDTRYQTGIPFALWWDAVDQNLNSCFVHTFRGSQLNHHLPLLGPQSQVLFSFQVEHGFFGTQSRQVTTGEARLNLYQAVGKRANVAESTMRRSMVDAASVSVDIPIEWDSGDDESQQLPTVLPLKISYSTVPLSTYERPIDRDDTVFSDCFGSVEHVGDSTSTEAKNFMADFETHGLSRTADAAVGIASQSADVGLDPINSDNVSRNGEDSVDALTVSSVPADNLNPICESHQKDITASADDARSYSGESDGSSLELTDDCFKPITLTSFGIEEMELSPLGVDEESPEKYAVASPAAISPQTRGGLDRSGVSVDAVSGDDSISAPQTVLSAKEEQVQAGGKTTPDSTQSPCPGIDDGTSTNDAQNWAAVSEEVTTVSGIVAADSTGDMEDDPSAFDAAHNDCAESLSLEDNIGNSIDTERRPECIAAITAQTVEYADKSAQVGISELNIWAPAVNESPRSVNGDDVCADTPGSDDAQKGAAGEGSTVDVACDAMPMTSISIVGGSETQYEAEVASQSSCAEAGEESEDMDLLDDSRSDFSDDGADSPDSVYGSNESSTKSLMEPPEQLVPRIVQDENIHESPQKEKLELVYEMLCEMRDSHAAKPLERPAASADTDTERLPGCIPSNPACTVDYADKCVQTDLCELAEAVNESPPSVGGDDVSADTPRSDEPQVTAGGEPSTVDVGCDAMQVATVSIAVGSEAPFEEEAPADNGDVEVGKDSDDMEMDDDLNSVIADGIGDSADSIDDEKEGRVPPPESSLVSPEQLTVDCESPTKPAPPPAVQNEKLELMYEMLREMRDLYAAKLLEKPPAPAEDVRCHKEDLEGGIGTLSPKASFASPEIKDSGDKACACSTPTSSRGPISPKTKGLILDKSIAPDIPSSIGLRQQEFAHTSRVISPLLRPEQNFKSKIIRRDMSSAQDALGSSLGVSGEVDHCRVSSNRGWLSSSDITWGKKAQCSRQAPEKDDRHLSAHSLFAHDSETERIARIMQGSMKYWMKDDSSCSGGDRESDEEETDDDCYF